MTRRVGLVGILIEAIFVHTGTLIAPEPASRMVRQLLQRPSKGDPFGGVLSWGYPELIQNGFVSMGKPMVLGYPYSRKPQCGNACYGAENGVSMGRMMRNHGI